MIQADEENDSEPPGPSDRWIWLLFAGILVVWLIFVAGAKYFLGTWDEAGKFGDTFGAINALFSGMAFGALVVTLILQRRELELQRRELRLQRAVMNASNEALKSQADAQEKQFRAAAASVRLEAIKLRVEQERMYAKQLQDASQHKYLNPKLEEYARAIDQLADELNSTERKHPPNC